MAHRPSALAPERNASGRPRRPSHIRRLPRRFPSLPQGALERFESLEQLRAMEHGHVIVVHRASHPPAAGVDTPADLERVRLIYAKQT